MRVLILRLVILAAVLTTGLSAQQPAPLRVSSDRGNALTAPFLPPPARSGRMDSGYKEPGTATLISVLITGGGQFWAGDTKRGLTLFGIGWGSVIVGCGIAHSLSPCEIGLLASAGMWVYGIVDAAPTARRMNSARGATVSFRPFLLPSDHPRLGLGFSVDH